MERIPILEHAGIVVCEYNNISVWHLTPESGIRKDGISNFLKNRHIIDIRRNIISISDIEKKISEMKNMKYNILDFNCFHFIEQMSVKS